MDADADTTLPDLHTVTDSGLPTSYLDSNSTNKDNEGSINLISPPAVPRFTGPPVQSSTQNRTNLGDLLCTLNFDVIPGEDKTHSTPPIGNRKVVTLTPQIDSLPNIPTTDSQPVQYLEQHIGPLPAPTHKVVTPSVPASTTPSRLPGPITISDHNSSPAINSPRTVDLPRKVVTPDLVSSTYIDEVDKTPGRQTADPNNTQQGTDASHNIPMDDIQTPKSNTLSNSLSSPRSVVTNPDVAELETANALLELGNTPNAFNAMYDNSELLPVDTAPLEDFTRSLHDESEGRNDDAENTDIQTQVNKDVNNNNNEHSDSDKTVDYTHERTEAKITDEMSPKGKISYKHYGIVRPSKTKSRTMSCYYCKAVFHSKKAINEHHKAEHTRVRCPDCSKVFPTPDALQRHRYIHDKSHQYKCDICKKLCAFKSDLEMHMAIHGEDCKWYCKYDGCGRDFKRKSDLTAHEVVHTGETFMCEFSTCNYTNKDPRLVKRHQRVHTRVAKVKCPECAEKFVFYQQMKRHREKYH